jgi:hypothetical protein
MKTSEFRKLIREEVKKVLREDDSFGADIDQDSLTIADGDKPTIGLHIFVDFGQSTKVFKMPYPKTKTGFMSKGDADKFEQIVKQEVKQHAPKARSIYINRIIRNEWNDITNKGEAKEWPYKWPAELYKTLPGIPNFLDNSPYPSGFNGSSSKVSEEQVTKAIDMLVQKSFTSEDFATLCNKLKADMETVDAAIDNSKNKKYFKVDTEGEEGTVEISAPNFKSDDSEEAGFDVVMYDGKKWYVG